MSKMIHLSHTDLDGYGCQLVTYQLKPDVIYFNANYGEIDDVLSKIYDIIQENDKLLITDLNLTLEQSDNLQMMMNTKKFTTVLIDHHGTGQESADKYSWYNLDTSKCATASTFEYFKNSESYPILSKIVDLVNTYDMWIKENKYDFERATLLSNTIFETSIDSKFDAEFKINILKEIGTSLVQGLDASVVESNIPFIISETLHELCSDETMRSIISDDNICSSYKMSIFPALEMKSFLTYSVNGQNVQFFKDITSNTFQYSSDYLFSANPKYKDCVFAKISSNGNMSFRYVNKNAVQIAKIFCGGGHSRWCWRSHRPK